MEFQQSEQIATRRRWVIVLVDSSDGVTGKTGQTGTAYISINGGTPAASTNSIVEVDSVNMPGHYYLELTAAELGTLGMISIYYKAGGTLAFHDRGYVTYDDPFARHGGFATGGTSSSGGIRREQADDLLKKIREIVKDELSKLPEATPQDNSEQIGLLNNIIDIVSRTGEVEPIDFSPVLQAINSIDKPKDYKTEFTKVLKQLESIAKVQKLDTKDIQKFVDDLNTRIDNTAKVVTTVNKSVDTISNTLTTVNTELDKFSSTLAEQSDMDKRFDAMYTALNNQRLDGITKEISKLPDSINTTIRDVGSKLAKLMTLK